MHSDDLNCNIQVHIRKKICECGYVFCNKVIGNCKANVDEKLNALGHFNFGKLAS